ncbi:MAG: Vitamin B12 transporter BtuB [Calditrichaeota bacterium]|nr:Vitamin B12 transporter BtuB [Calditrichota bacterium]
MFRFVSPFLLLMFVASTAFSATLAGRVVDADTGNPVVNASVVVSGGRGTTTGEGGEWSLANVRAPVTVTVGHIAYWRATRTFRTIPSEPVEIALRPRVHRSEGVILSVDRVDREHATVPFTNVPEDELETRYYAQDLPVALEGLPSMTTTTDAGNALGYSYLNMRGFDFKRITVLLNGVMLNDPEDFYVYWVDLADFGANVEDVQVQRGAGSALLGLPAVGGTIDVQTKTISREPSVSVEYGIGSYDTQRGSVHLASGPIKDRYFIDARFSRIKSDGYRDEAWADYFSYYLSAARLDPNMTTRIVLFGGPIRNHLAYLGITRQQAKKDRTLNPLSYPELGNYDESDNFYQPHYQLHHTWDISEDLRLKNTFYYIRGEGYFNVYYPAGWGYGWDFWDLPDPGSDVGDMIARQWVENHQGGWQPRLTWKSGDHKLDVGGQFVSHRSRRWGELIWAETLPDEADPNHVWYDYQGRKRIISGYAQDRWQLNRRLSLTGALQLAHVQYEILKDVRFGESFTEPYTFMMPRAGFSYKLTPPVRLWGSYSRITREPRLKDHYWAETGHPVRRSDHPSTPAAIEPETLDDFELGMDWSTSRFAVRGNVYWMELSNEIVDIGQYDVFGQPVIENAGRSRRLGIEVGGRFALENGMFAEGNANLSRNRFIEYTSPVVLLDPDVGDPPVQRERELDLSDNRIIMAPERILNLSVGVRRPLYEARLSAHHVGERYVTNTENLAGVSLPDTLQGSATLKQNRSLDAYTRVDFHAAVRLFAPYGEPGFVRGRGLPRVELSLHVRNLLDSEYFLTGSADAWDVLVIPAATRSWFAGLKLTL